MNHAVRAERVKGQPHSWGFDRFSVNGRDRALQMPSHESLFMRMTLKLYAMLSDYLPTGAKDNRVEIDVAAGTTVGDLITRYQLPEKLVHLVLVNGVFIPPEARATKTLIDNDVLAIWPPIAGG